LKTGQAPWSKQRLEREYFQSDGSLVYIEGHVYSIPTDKGFLLVSVSKDISERKRVEQALIASEELSRSTLNGLPAHIAIIDQEGTILAVNQAWKDFARENGAILRRPMKERIILKSVITLKAQIPLREHLFSKASKQYFRAG
jgi:PAS domain-containing protein